MDTFVISIGPVFDCIKMCSYGRKSTFICKTISFPDLTMSHKNPKCTIYLNAKVNY